MKAGSIFGATVLLAVVIPVLTQGTLSNEQIKNVMAVDFCKNLTCDDCAVNSSCAWCNGSKCVPILDVYQCSNSACTGTDCVCEQPEQCTDGIFPCSKFWVGNIILMLIYGVILGYSAKLISDGSEMLLLIMNPGIIGGLVLPVLGAVPDAAIIVFSAIGGTTEQAQKQVAVGMGTLAGSTVMLLTIPYGLSLIVGRCNIVDGVAQDNYCKGYNIFKQGTTVDLDVPINAAIAMITSLSYFIVQGVAFYYLLPGRDPMSDQAKFIERIFSVAGLVVCFVFFILYSIFQLVNTQYQAKRIRVTREKEIKMEVIDKMKKIYEEKMKERLLEASKPVHTQEEREETLSAKFGGMWKRKTEEAVSERDRLLKESETVVEVTIEEKDENDLGVPLWRSTVRHIGKRVKKISGGKDVETGDIEVPPMLDEDEDDEYEDWSKWRILAKALTLLVIGTTFVTVFSDPMVDTISELGIEFHIPSFYISFVVTPFCSNASELISSLVFAAKKKRSNSTITFSQLFGAAIMNNTLCLGIFYLLVVLRGLAWTFSAETLCIFASTMVIGIIGVTRKTTRLYWVPIIFAVYPLSIALVAFLEYMPFIQWT